MRLRAIRFELCCFSNSAHAHRKDSGILWKQNAVDRHYLNGILKVVIAWNFESLFVIPNVHELKYLDLGFFDCQQKKKNTRENSVAKMQSLKKNMLVPVKGILRHTLVIRLFVTIVKKLLSCSLYMKREFWYIQSSVKIDGL